MKIFKNAFGDHHLIGPFWEPLYVVLRLLYRMIVYIHDILVCEIPNILFGSMPDVFCCCFFFLFCGVGGEWVGVDGRWYAQTYIARKTFEYSTSQLPNTPGIDGTKLEILLMIRIICISLLWTLFILMDFPIHVDTRWMACPFRILMDHRSTFRYFDILLCLQIVFIQANSAASNKMPWHCI